MNFADFLQQQKQEDRQAFIVHYPAASGKTQFALKVCQAIPQIHYFSLLDYVLAHPELPHIEQMDSATLQTLLLSLEKKLQPEKTSVLVDQMDFLLNTWKVEEKQTFLQWLRMPLRTPSLTRMTYIFFIQTDDVFSTAMLTNSHHQSRILTLNAFDIVYL